MSTEVQGDSSSTESYCPKKVRNCVIRTTPEASKRDLIKTLDDLVYCSLTPGIRAKNCRKVSSKG